MNTNNYAGQGSLPPELEQRVQSELAVDERLVWVGRPRPGLYRGQTVFLSIFGGFFAAIALFMFGIGLVISAGFAGFGAAAGGAGGGLAGCLPLFFCLFTVPFMLIGIYLATAPLWMPKRIARIAYALTDRRAIIWEPGWFSGQYTVRTYTREGLGRMYRTDRADGSGDLVFEEFYTQNRDTNGSASTTRNQRGFLAIDRVRKVEELLRLTLMG